MVEEYELTKRRYKIGISSGQSTSRILVGVSEIRSRSCFELWLDAVRTIKSDKFKRKLREFGAKSALLELKRHFDILKT